MVECSCSKVDGTLLAPYTSCETESATPHSWFDANDSFCKFGATASISFVLLSAWVTVFSIFFTFDRTGRIANLVKVGKIGPLNAPSVPPRNDGSAAEHCNLKSMCL